MFGTMMKPTRLQYFFASPWPSWMWFTVIPLGFAFAMGRICTSFLDPLAGWGEFVHFAWYVAIALLLGFFLALFPGWFVIGPLYYDRELKNGGPFKVGDTVQILSGPHKNRITQVYATWQGNSLRVELGEKEKKEFTDIFSPAELLREVNAEQDGAANGSHGHL
jgi:hypothetical protein